MSCFGGSFRPPRFGYLDIRERPINLYSMLSSYWNTNYWIWGYLKIVWSGFQFWDIKGYICVMFWMFRFASCFGCSFGPQSVWVPRHKRTSYKLIFGVVIVLQYQILNFRQFRDGLVRVSILVRKRVDLRHVLEVYFGRKAFGCLDIRERPIKLYSVLSTYWNTNYWIWGHLDIVWSGFQFWYIKG